MPIVLRLDPSIPVHTPKGKGRAIIFRDYGEDHHDLWTVIIDATGEPWTFRNPEIRFQTNETMGTRATGLDLDGQVLSRVPASKLTHEEMGKFIKLFGQLRDLLTPGAREHLTRYPGLAVDLKVRPDDPELELIITGPDGEMLSRSVVVTREEAIAGEYKSLFGPRVTAALKRAAPLANPAAQKSA